MKDLTIDNKPKVIIICDPNFLGLSIIENLISSFCSVTIISKNGNGWKQNAPHLFKNNLVDISESIDKISPDNFKYAIAVVDNETNNSSLIEADKLVQVKGIKIILVSNNYFFDQQKSNERKKLIDDLKSNKKDIAVFYIGDLLGKRINISKQNYFCQLLSSCFDKVNASIDVINTLYYPSDVAEVSKQIVKALLSFGYWGEEINLSTQPVNSEQLIIQLKNNFANKEFSQNIQGSQRFLLNQGKKIDIKSDPTSLLIETISWLQDHTKKEVKAKSLLFPEIQKNNKPKLKRQKSKSKADKKNIKLIKNISFQKRNIASSFIILVVLLLFPFITQGIGLGFLVLAYNTLGKGNISASKKLVLISKKSADISFWETGFLAKAPLLGELYQDSLGSVIVMQKICQTTNNTLTLAQQSVGLISQTKKSTQTDLYKLSADISTGIDDVYNQTGFIQSEIQSLGGVYKKLFSKYFDNKQLTAMRRQLISYKEIAKNIPDLLGAEGKKTYLLLFQNNMELRPTGGFIGSYGLVTFDKGKLVNLSVSDIYSADGQLNGHVEPPLPIKQYLGEANWYFRDSNWDPDFNISAARAEWFLDKEVGQSVDGVIAIDLQVIKNILNNLGPLEVKDYDLDVDTNNLYEITQSQAEKDFFPGSYSKASFLTALSQEIVNKITDSGFDQYLPLAKALYLSMRQKDIQFFFHNNEVQNSIYDLGYDGGMDVIPCTDECISDWYAFVDANIGVNKGNYTLDRSFDLSVDFTKQNIQNTLIVNFKNNTDPSVGESAIYKSYSRIYLPSLSINYQVSTQQGGILTPAQFTSEQVRSTREIGSYLEVNPKGQTNMIYSWQTIQSDMVLGLKQYRLYIRKQSGTINDPLSISIIIPTGYKLISDTPFSLTTGGVYTYNTNLFGDFVSQIYIEKI